MNNGKLGKPIIKVCPHCNVESLWYWTYQEDETQRGLNAVECSCELDPFDLDTPPYSIWKKDESNFYPVKDAVKQKESDLMELVPPSKRISRSSTES